LHDVEVMPPEVRGLEIFISNVAEFSGSGGVATMAAAAVAHFCALEGIQSPFGFPRFGKILQGIRLSYGKATKPKKPFTPIHMGKFMDLVRTGTLRVRVESSFLACSLLPAVAQGSGVL
jgi:hypothetical protein